ncbi:MAG: HTH-type transcriptional repressor GlaR [Desulfovibrio sp.]
MSGAARTEQVLPWIAPESPSPAGDGVASAEAVQRILSDITRGALGPGTKLKVRELKERYGISATPLREALSQLAARGFVLLEDRKGFSVPPVSLEELTDLSSSRQIVEGEALRLAIAHGDAAWEGHLLSYLHQLKREIERRDTASREWQDNYERQHRLFHRALISACPYGTLTDFCESLYIKMTRYRRLLKERGFAEHIGNGAHDPIVDAALSRNSDLAVPLLREHINVPASVMKKYLREDEIARRRR